MRRLCAAYLLLAIGILGCSAPPDNKPKRPVISSVWLAQQVKLEALRNFRLQGKMAFRSKSQRLGANFNWEQKGDDYSLRLTSFLGTSLLKLDAKDGVITVISEEGKKFKGDDANKLLRKLVGINLPLEQMIGWLKGLPSAQNGFVLDENNQLSQLSQYRAPQQKRGWQVKYLGFMQKGDVALPEAIQMTKDSQRVDLIIAKWEVIR